MHYRYLHLYVDDVHIGTTYTAWPIRRIMNRLMQANPSAKSYEVRVHETDETTVLLKASS